MTDSERDNREMPYVRRREDNMLLLSGFYPVAVAWENTTKETTIDVKWGKPRVAFIGTSAQGMISNQAKLLIHSRGSEIFPARRKRERAIRHHYGAEGMNTRRGYLNVRKV